MVAVDTTPGPESLSLHETLFWVGTMQTKRESNHRWTQMNTDENPNRHGLISSPKKG
jgi:hypothetical protein